MTTRVLTSAVGVGISAIGYRQRSSFFSLKILFCHRRGEYYQLHAQFNLFKIEEPSVSHNLLNKICTWQFISRHMRKTGADVFIIKVVVVNSILLPHTEAKQK